MPVHLLCPVHCLPFVVCPKSPFELNNVADRPEYAEYKDEMKRRLIELRHEVYWPYVPMTQCDLLWPANTDLKSKPKCSPLLPDICCTITISRWETSSGDPLQNGKRQFCLFPNLQFIRRPWEWSAYSCTEIFQSSKLIHPAFQNLPFDLSGINPTPVQ